MVDQFYRLVVTDRGIDLADVVAILVEERSQSIVRTIHDELRRELQELAVRQFHTEEVRPGVIHPVIGGIKEIAFIDEEAPGIPRRVAAIEPDAIHIEGPAIAEVARAMIAAIVSAGNRDRHARERQLEVFEGRGKLTDLHVTIYYNVALDGVACATQRSNEETDFVGSIQKQRRIQDPKCVCGNRAGTAGESDPVGAGLILLPVLEEIGPENG